VTHRVGALRHLTMTFMSRDIGVMANDFAHLRRDASRLFPTFLCHDADRRDTRRARLVDASSRVSTQTRGPSAMRPP